MTKQINTIENLAHVCCDDLWNNIKKEQGYELMGRAFNKIMVLTETDQITCDEIYKTDKEAYNAILSFKVENKTDLYYFIYLLIKTRIKVMENRDNDN